MVTLSSAPPPSAQRPAFFASRIAGRIGAEIKGLQLTGKLAAEEVALVRSLLLRHKVLFFRGQNGLAGDSLPEFGRRLGALVPAPWPNGTGTVIEVRGRTNNWHTDMTFIDAYPAFSVLCAVVVPAAGGDTMWANTVTAYRDLPAELRAFANKTWAVHTNDVRLRSPYAVQPPEYERVYAKMFDATIYEAEHPLVRVHPETGERSLVLGDAAWGIKDCPRPGSTHLLELLQSYVTRPENTVRWRWKVGDVAIWDNRATQHYAIDDYGDQPRILRRVTIAGEVPVSCDGRKSVMRQRKMAPL